MKGKIAALVAGLVLGATGTAGAMTGVYWDRGGSGYNCEGTTHGVICTSGNYDVGVTKDYVFVQHRRTQKTFGCAKYVPFSRCLSDR